MKKVLSFIATILFIATVNAQDPFFSQWTKEETDLANTAANTQLTEQEQQVIYLCNLARLNGKKFWDTYASKHINNKRSSNISSLKSDLLGISNLPMLEPESALCKSATYHAEDLGQTGEVGHTSSNGKSFSERLESYFDCMAYAENCSYGYSQAIDIVMQLLIDDNVASLGHRKNILNPKYKSIGVSIRPHAKYRYNCVMDFADIVKDKLQQTETNK